MRESQNHNNSLYQSKLEHDACGVGFVVDVHGRESHDILEKAIQCVVNLTHRGAVDADAKTGDGAGVLTQIPRELFRRELAKNKIELKESALLGVGMIFFPKADSLLREQARQIIDQTVKAHKLVHWGWRIVPVDDTCLGQKASSTQPHIEQIMLGCDEEKDIESFERKLFLVRRVIEKGTEKAGIPGFYIPSFSCRTLVYKGLFVAPQLEKFYLDLKDKDYKTAIGLFHQRYSTNTFPNWFLAQPCRMLGHNGEINTIDGNRIWFKAREADMASPLWGEELNRLKPFIQEDGSDSASLDNALEILSLSGRGLLHNMMMMIPEAYQNMPHMDDSLRGFYEYHATLMEPWDGPASIAFSDGEIVGAILDRNGLRPARYAITKDGFMVMGSEAGMIELNDEEVIDKGRLGPGMMIAVDTRLGKVLKNDEIKKHMAQKQFYDQWVKENLHRVSTLNLKSDGIPLGSPLSVKDAQELPKRQTLFGFTDEEVKMVIEPMVKEGKDPVFSMGDDTPLAVLSSHPRLLYHYFKQRFAQVTNPPIDSIREHMVMSHNVAIGSRKNVLAETQEHCRLIKFPSPVILNYELRMIQKEKKDNALRSICISTLFDTKDGECGLEKALKRICNEAIKAVRNGSDILILSDRSVGEDKAYVPILLAVSAIHHYLIRQGARMGTSIVVESGEVWDIHHYACLLGFGATAVNPYLTLETIHHICSKSQNNIEPQQAFINYRNAVDKGLLKIMSKMGISTISSYRGAQIFEIIGINASVVDEYFTGTPSKIEGIGIKEIANEVLSRHQAAYANPDFRGLEAGSFYKYRKGGEEHAYNPAMVKQLQKSVKTGDYNEFKKFSEIVHARHPICIRDILKFKPTDSIPIDEVEPIEEICKRFVTAAMSLGALSPEAHETLAIAVNRIGGKSNSGEGGEDSKRFEKRENGDWPRSRIKQVASGRFGVTPEYLVNCDELQIKMAQGSKPGEGGQIPGKKITEYIAFLRHSVLGVTLISPPPHHDIYSIEDLAQLIYDLKMVNPKARVSVKLVASAGVGTIAAGVAKGYADHIQISGHDGGTGASPLSSIKSAGGPWELGLAETQQTLIINDLRGRVRLQADGGMKTGRDVVIAALLGADEYGFGTAALVAEGCVMTRKCHLNNCPVGVATQDEFYREKFVGTVEMVVHYFRFVAQEIRELLASLGARKLDDIIGHTDLLKAEYPSDFPKASYINLDPLLANVDPEGKNPKRCMQYRNDRVDEPLDDTIIRDAKEAIEKKLPLELKYSIRNINRSVTAKLTSEIARRYGNEGLPKGTLQLTFNGTAGQSFGVFLIKGLRLSLIGEANDYVGKGMNGGEIIIKPIDKTGFNPEESIIIGNTVLYGATGGEMYVRGQAGERFAVRNSGACAVIEGVGDHACEYMTGGVVVVLGHIGRNFAAGMSGGMAFVLDEEAVFSRMVNLQMVGFNRVEVQDEIDLLKELIRRHHHNTGSVKARNILEKWDHTLGQFWQVVPHPPFVKEDAVAKVRTGLERVLSVPVGE